ncbi:MAG: hypothetical protein HQK53_07230 [Oligoflexia bacterium]|nr:hypothetical protein [Oligoflexia bacterium]
MTKTFFYYKQWFRWFLLQLSLLLIAIGIITNSVLTASESMSEVQADLAKAEEAVAGLEDQDQQKEESGEKVDDEDAKNADKNAEKKAEDDQVRKKRIRLDLDKLLDNAGMLSNGDQMINPAISTRCRELLKYREERIRLRQKAQFLSRRIQRLQNEAPERRVYYKKKMDFIAIEVSHELHILNFQIQVIEEDIVKKGCPGIKI